MAIKTYMIETVCRYNYDLKEDGTGLIDMVKPIFGAYDSTPDGQWSTDLGDINEALLESEEFIQAAQENGFDTSFNEMEPFEVYEKMFGIDIEEDILHRILNSEYIHEFAGNILSDLFERNNDEVQKYLEENENIEVEYMDADEFDLAAEIKMDESMAKDVEADLTKIIESVNDKIPEKTDTYKDYELKIVFFAGKMRSQVSPNELEFRQTSD